MSDMIPDQMPILTVTLNPTLDMSTDADRVQPEAKIRCDAPTLDPGGGGTNVARAVKILGGQATAFVALAGFRGQQVAALLDREALPYHSFDLPGETRLSLAVGNRADGDQYRFVMPGPTWREEDVNRCLSQIKDTLPADAFLVLSGSMPPGVEPGFIAALSDTALAAGARLVLDTSGPTLANAARGRSAGLSVLRLDQAESEDLAGHSLPTPEDSVAFGLALLERRAAEIVVMGRGAEGSVLVGPTGAFFARGQKVPVKSKVGAGDSFLGAFTLSLARNEPPEQALCHGVAAASAAVMSAATALCAREDVAGILPRVILSRL
ncbi:1-phosphofructokinase family hexose kinase [Aliiroseovarius crassostreae]|uniref:1-phosphofructokinase family hexose kinase n=1 Tax=Aliiroseovarius crassostreae TaxID=154981 RepID=UPI003C7B60E9